MEDENKSQTGKQNREFKIELTLFLILGFLLGVMLKTEAVKKLTIGFNDYKVAAFEQGYDVNEMQKNLIAEQKQAEEDAKQAQDEVANEGEGDNKEEAQQEEQPAGACGV